MWNGLFFSDFTLTAAGLIIQLGHCVGDTCSAPSPLHDLMVFDLSGVHRLVVRYCGCDGTLSKHTQLLRARWFPATLDRPATAFSFNILDFFHELQNQNKCNPYDFYRAILQRSDAAGLNPGIVCLLFILSAFLLLTDSQNRYNETTLVFRLWTHIQLLKRGGAVHHSPPDKTLPDGSMAIHCPACPQPGKNTVDFPKSES